MPKLFGLDIYSKGKDSLLNDISKIEGKVHIISGNAEVLKKPLKDLELFKEFSSPHSIIIPDGISVSIPLKVKGNKDVTRIAGIDLMVSMLKNCDNDGKGIFLLGARDSVLNKLIVSLKEQYPNLVITGYNNGFFDKDNREEIIKNIKDSNAEILFVAMGTPVQEDFIISSMNELPCRVFMGVGGSFDVLSGEISRAPQWISNIGMEWLYRIVKDPSKIKRLSNNLLFTLKGILKG